MWWWGELIKFGVMQGLNFVWTGGASLAGPIAFFGLLWSRIFRSPSFFTLVRIAAFLVIVATCIVVRWQQKVILQQLEETEKIESEGACKRHYGCERQKTEDPANRFHVEHNKQCNKDKWQCETTAEDRAWARWVDSIPGWGEIFDTLASKFIIVSLITMFVSFILPWFGAAPSRAVKSQFIAIGDKQLQKIMNHHLNPEGVDEIHED